MSQLAWVGAVVVLFTPFWLATKYVTVLGASSRAHAQNFEAGVPLSVQVYTLLPVFTGSEGTSVINVPIAEPAGIVVAVSGRSL